MEMRSEALAFNVEEVWAAVDVLAFVCAAYEQSPGVKATFVRAWRETTILIEKQFIEGDNIEWDETAALTPDVLAAFDRLESVAQKYPPEEW
jgi:hypothetical protein